MFYTDQRTRRHAAVISIMALVFALAGSSPAMAATFTVTTTADAGAGSLRQAILDANAAAGADVVNFSLPAGPQTITLTSGEIVISDAVSINGTGASMLTVSGSGSSRIFYISSSAIIADMTLTAGNSTGGVYSGFGGAVLVFGGSMTMNDCIVRNNSASATAGAIAMGFGVVNLNRCTISGNVCGNVSGIYLQDGTSVITSSTISGNSGSGISEAIRNNAASSNATLTLINSTVSGNTAGTGNAAIRGQGAAAKTSTITLVNATITQNTTNASGQHGAIWLQPGPTHVLQLRNTIVSGNLSGGLPYDIEGSADPASVNNLIGTGGGLTNGVNGNIVGVDDPILGPLQNNGGPTATHEPLCSSPAIDAGDNSVTGLPYALATDQRGAGFVRSSHGAVDIGAYEAVIPANVVTNTMNAGPGSLRDAITFANANPGPDVVTFCIPQSDPGYDALTGAFTITPVGGLPALGSDLVVDGWSQSGFAGSPIIELNGSSSPGNFGFVINNANHVTVRGFVINRYLGNPGNGIGIGVFGAGATNNWIYGCHIGTNVAGTAALPNGQIGIWVSGGPSNNIIGTNADGVNDIAERNVISGNNRSAVEINSDENIVAGNYLGVNAQGTAALANGEHGVRFLGTATGNLVGGSVAAARNVISGNAQYGILIQGAATANQVLGNLIGTDATGTTGIPNNGGVGVFSGSNTVGGPGSSMRNIISGNTAAGIYLFSDGNTVQGNYIGTDVTGNSAVPNAAGIYHTAIWCSGNNNLIGGLLPGEGNVVSGNNHYGIFVGYTTATGNVIQGNLVGLNASGTAALGNRLEGVYLHGPANILGGTSPAARNVIAASRLEDGVEVSGNANIVEGNYIGTDISGSVALPNEKSGIFVNGASNTMIGGSVSGAGNLISGNKTDGIQVSGNAMMNSILGNSIFANGALGIDMGPIGVTANDLGDGDIGPNGLQNYPVITSTSDICGNAQIHGTLNSTPNSTFTLEVFTNTACDPSNYGEGQTLLGTTSTSTDGNGDATFTLALGAPLPLGTFLTATATDADGNTSEFSQCYTVVAPDIDVPVLAHNYGNVDLGTWSDYVFTIDNTGTGPLTITGVSISGANASEFSVQTAPASPIAANGSTTMVIRFAPTTAPLAIKTATVSISSDDPCGNENPVDLAVSGYGIPALPHAYLLLAKQNISIDAQVGFEGDTRSNDKVSIHKGNPSTYNGSIWAVNKIDIDKDNTVVGDLMSSSLKLSSGVMITGTQTVTAPASYLFPSMSYAAGSTNISVPSSGSYTLAPGSYKEVKVNSGGTLFLSSGTYYIKKLEVKKNGVVSVDITAGPVVINVVEKIDFDKETEVAITPLGAGGTRWVTFNSLGSVSVDKNSRILGTINAFDEKVEIKKEVSFKGAICAKEISIDKDGTSLYHTSTMILPKTRPSIAPEAGITSFTLGQNYPNPFNPSTVIEYSIASTEQVMLKVFDPMGREVETLVNAELKPGSYSATFNATNYRSGVYLYQLTVGDHQETRRMTLLK